MEKYLKNKLTSWILFFLFIANEKNHKYQKVIKNRWNFYILQFIFFLKIY